ncbi:SusC/RagA family TonB-linked outer membrane protein [Persicitalea jodogahamensis]|uniref:SusC/RagA family TonB-linked outer membrane protein n=1 Tax=Persicitalea jodogahamensis TaxID=402147 RepID=A0A8J3GBE3_9BACT|nr:SusC/RagA family TonB-linked outer membrane protein [Persicitalea jodogahamensis]GHB86556.1 SusC/RagA family TonB-linked outer membrane protein [Persicitalea jodogahamensis]
MNMLATKIAGRVIIAFAMSTMPLFVLAAQPLTAFAKADALHEPTQGISLENVLQKLEERHNVKFSYPTEEVRAILLQKEKYQKKTVEETLKVLLDGTRLSFRRINKRYFVIYRIESPGTNRPAKTTGKETSTTVVAQLRAIAVTISGKVTDKGGEAIPGATVLLKGTTTGTATDKAGEFTLQSPQTDGVLVFSYIGMATKEVPFSGSGRINVKLEEVDIALEEVVVIGYGQREKKDVTTSISTIDSETIAKSTVSMNPEMAMQGRMSGVQVLGNTGNPMDRPTVRIRGVNTWGVSQPLYVVDGIPITELGSGIEGEDARVRDVRGPINIMTMIDPNDIESISVLKDASAAAIYGVRAANGVILITTKRGKSETPTIDLSARYGLQNIPKTWDVLTTPQFVDYYAKAYAANPNQVLDPEFNPASPRYLGNTRETYDWQTPIINKNAVTQDYSVRVSGRTDKTDYYVSAGFAETEGVLIQESLERYSMNLKLNTNINKWLRTGINYRLAYVEGVENNESDLIDRAQTPPWQPVYDPTGPPFLKGYAPAIVGYDANGKWSTQKLYGEGTRNNLMGRMALNSTDYESLRNLGSAYVEITPLIGLSIKGNFSIDAYENDRFRFRDWNADYFSYSNSSDPNGWAGGQSVGQYAERATTNTNIIKEVTVNYNKTFGNHRFDLLFNGMDQQYNAKYVNGSTDFVTTRDKSLLRLGGTNQYTLLESDLFRWSLQGLLGRVSYNFNQRYYVDLTVRRDGSNRFAPQNRWGTFPSASAAWRVSAEPFMQSLNWISDLKLRAGWGQLGNQEVRPLAYLSPVIKSPTYAFGSIPGGNGLGNYGIGAAMFSFPNPDLQWEKTTTTNIGFDASLFNHLTASFEYYTKATDGILQETSIPPSVGSKLNPVANIASVKNSGIELSLSYSNTIGKLNYSLGGNFTTVKNEVLSTYENIPFGGESNRIEAGFPINYIYGYKVGGIFQNQQEIDEWLKNNTDQSVSQTYQPGDRYFQDINGAPTPEKGTRFYTPGPDGRIDQFDRTYLGKTIPGYFYGFNLGLDTRGFDLAVFFQGVGDVQKYNYARATMEHLSSRGSNMSTAVLNAWTPENPDTDISRAVVGDPSNSLRFSSHYVENAGYLRLGNVQLGFTFPQSALNAIGNSIKQLRLYASVANAFVITNWQGLDPENDASPMPRVFNLGLNVKF